MKYLKCLMLVSMLTGCGNLYTHQLQDLIKQCGGSIEDIHTIWIDEAYSSARCVSGETVTSLVNESK
jgi:hypothetical protein